MVATVTRKMGAVGARRGRRRGLKGEGEVGARESRRGMWLEGTARGKDYVTKRSAMVVVGGYLRSEATVQRAGGARSWRGRIESLNLFQCSVLGVAGVHSFNGGEGSVLFSGLSLVGGIWSGGLPGALQAVQDRERYQILSPPPS